MKPVCFACGRIYRCADVGVSFVETMSGGSPYKLWAADRYECPLCHHSILIPATSPIAEHFQDTFAEQVERREAHLLVSA